MSANDIISQTHNRAGQPARVSFWDITGIVQAGFCKYCRYYREEDAGTGKESRLCLFRDHMSTLVHDSTLDVFLQDWCVRVRSTGNRHRIFYTLYQYLVRKNRDKKQYYMIMNYVGPG